MKKQPKPAPVSVNVICSLCGEPWNLHAEVDGEVSTLECIRLLKARAPRAITFPQPYPYPAYPYVRPWVQWSYTQTSGRSVPIVTVGQQTPTNVVLASATTG